MPDGRWTTNYYEAEGARRAWENAQSGARPSAGGGGGQAAPIGQPSYEVGPGGERRFYGMSVDQLTNIADPWSSQRGQYQETLSNLIKDPSSFVNSPLFQSATQAGIDAVNRSAASRGLLKSGNRLQALMDYGQQQAPKTFFQMTDLLSTLSGARNQNPGGGLQAAANLGNLGVSEQNAATNRYQAETGRLGVQNQANQIANQQAQWQNTWRSQQEADEANRQSLQQQDMQLQQQTMNQSLQDFMNLGRNIALNYR